MRKIPFSLNFSLINPTESIIWNELLSYMCTFFSFSFFLFSCWKLEYNVGEFGWKSKQFIHRSILGTQLWHRLGFYVCRSIVCSTKEFPRSNKMAAAETQHIVLYCNVLLSETDLKGLCCTQIYSIYHAQMDVSKVKFRAWRHLRLLDKNVCTKQIYYKAFPQKMSFGLQHYLCCSFHLSCFQDLFRAILFSSVWFVFSLGKIHLGKFVHSNHTWVGTKTTAPRPFRCRGLIPVQNELCGGNMI